MRQCSRQVVRGLQMALCQSIYIIRPISFFGRHVESDNVCCTVELKTCTNVPMFSCDKGMFNQRLDEKYHDQPERSFMR